MRSPLQTPMAETSYLPLEIIEIILSKLSFFKSLLRFKSVSKSWNSIISDPLFIQTHHQQQSKSSQDLFVRRSPTSGVLTLVKLQDTKFEIVQRLESPYANIYDLCCCEGVLLCTDPYNIHVLWNPSTRTHKTISIPFQRSCNSSHGVCPDPTNDGFFKVVVMSRLNYSVYSTKTESLIIDRKKFDYTDYGCRILHRNAVCVGGAVYWAWPGPNIIYYDPRDDKLKVLQKLPEYVKDRDGKMIYLADLGDGKMIYLADLGGSLCLYCEGEDETTIKMWIKEKGIDNHSWKDLITIENWKFGSVWDFEPQCLFGNKIVIREGLVSPNNNNNVVIYSPLEKTFEQVLEFCWSFGHGLVPYVDSPVK